MSQFSQSGSSYPDDEGIEYTDMQSDLDTEGTGRRRRVLSTTAFFVLIALCVLSSALLIAGVGGVAAGRKERAIYATETTAADLGLQYELGLADMQNGNYSLAAQRFTWILQRDPNYPGVAENLAQARQQGNTLNEPSPTVIPTSSAVTIEEKFLEAKQHYDAQDWPVAIARLQDVQSLDPTYRRADVQNMLYTSLQTLGLVYVRGSRLEEGIFLLEQAEEIQPLDNFAAGELLVANLYITAKSYWNLNWQIVIQNLVTIYEVAPDYRDVADRLHAAYAKYGDQMALSGAFCDAVDQYGLALEIIADEDVSASRDKAVEECNNPTPDGTLTLTPQETQTLTLTPAGTVSPTPTPTLTPAGTADVTVTPTLTPTLTPTP